MFTEYSAADFRTIAFFTATAKAASVGKLSNSSWPPMECKWSPASNVPPKSATKTVVPPGDFLNLRAKAFTNILGILEVRDSGSAAQLTPLAKAPAPTILNKFRRSGFDMLPP
jgi:hypothetical protein